MFLKKYDASLKRNLHKEINNAVDDEYIDDTPLKNLKLILNHMKISERDYYWKGSQGK